MAHLISSNKRKVNYAFYVKCIMPSGVLVGYALEAIYYAINTYMNNYLRHFLFDSFEFDGIIRLTRKLSYLGDQYHGRLWRCKTGGAWAKWHFKCPSRGCYGRFIFGERVFRSPRPGAGQVRDASAGSGGWSICFNSGENIRLFSGVILSDTAGIQPTRISRPYAASTRTQACSQVDRRCYVIRFSLQKQKIFLAGDRFSESHKTAVWFERTSSQHRTSVAATVKKKAVNFFEPDTCLDHCVERYEQLRRMVLEGRDYCCQGWGLALLIHRGFTAWIYAFSKMESSQQESVAYVTLAPDKTCLAIPDTIRGQMIMAISEMALGTLQGVVL